MTGRDAPHHVHEIPDLTLACGSTLRPARIAYQTYGTLNAAKDNAIVYPTWYSGRHWDNEWLIGEDKALDPNRWFIIVPNMLGNGLSSSPSNTPPPWDRARFPQIAVRDNVAAQHRLVTEVFGIEKLALVLGWSMGAGQTYQWAVSHPEMVQRILPFCGSARTAPHNRVFLDSLRYALRADAAFAEGWYEPDALPVRGLRAFARIYAGWGFSQAFYWDEVCGGSSASPPSRTSRSGSGRASSSTAGTRTTCSPCSTRGGTATWAPPPASRPRRRPSPPSGRARSSCPPRRTSTSRPRTSGGPCRT
ncbi:hypothetical protein GCM10023320_78370 [Pseudonocardia adelaidensis]|uniref:AB hydrolase-1 domain-containing protein n=1 Tax=Pseudonocardia adelaidensis TaxID=648754 RepID=A0ABP9P7Q8_9PSEU